MPNILDLLPKEEKKIQNMTIEFEESILEAKLQGKTTRDQFLFLEDILKEKLETFGILCKKFDVSFSLRKELNDSNPPNDLNPVEKRIDEIRAEIRLIHNKEEELINKLRKENGLIDMFCNIQEIKTIVAEGGSAKILILNDEIKRLREEKETVEKQLASEKTDRAILSLSDQQKEKMNEEKNGGLATLNVLVRSQKFQLEKLKQINNKIENLKLELHSGTKSEEKREIINESFIERGKEIYKDMIIKKEINIDLRNQVFQYLDNNPTNLADNLYEQFPHEDKQLLRNYYNNWLIKIEKETEVKIKK